MIQMGDKVRDKITKLTGIVTSIHVYLHGCRRIGVQPEKLHEGRPIEAIIYDEPQLEVLQQKKVKEGSREKGGPRPPVRHKVAPLR